MIDQEDINQLEIINETIGSFFNTEQKGGIKCYCNDKIKTQHKVLHFKLVFSGLVMNFKLNNSKNNVKECTSNHKIKCASKKIKQN